MRPWLIDFKAEGLNLDRLVRLCGERGIALKSIRREGVRQMRGRVCETDMDALREIALRGGWQVDAGRRYGMGAAGDFLKRHLFQLALLVLVGALLLSAGMRIWRIDIVDAGSYEADLRLALDEIGIRPGIWRSDIDLSQVRGKLEWRYPALAWIDCGFRGMTLEIRVHEGRMPGGEVEIRGQGSVVAARDGVIDSVMTISGTPRVKKGDVVKKGDILIAGEERGSGESVHPVQAHGVVMAMVWDGAAVRVPLNETKTNYTGRKQLIWRLKTPWFDLQRKAECTFETAEGILTSREFGGLFLPVVLVEETRLEAEYVQEARELEEVQAEAGEAAMRRLSAALGDDEFLIDKWVKFSIIEDGVLEAFAVCRRCIDIACE